MELPDSKSANQSTRDITDNRCKERVRFVLPLIGIVILLLIIASHSQSIGIGSIGLFSLAKIEAAERQTSLPVRCDDNSARRYQPVWIADSNKLSEPKACIDMNGHLRFHESVKKPSFILLTEKSFTLTFPDLKDRIVLLVGPATYYPIRVTGNSVVFDVDAVNSVLKFFSMASPSSPDSNEQQARQTFFYFGPVATNLGKSYSKPARTGAESSTENKGPTNETKKSEAPNLSHLISEVLRTAKEYRQELIKQKDLESLQVYRLQREFDSNTGMLDKGTISKSQFDQSRQSLIKAQAKLADTEKRIKDVDTIIAEAESRVQQRKLGSAKVQDNKPYTREQVRHLVIGKSREDVVRILGKPDDQRSAGQIEYWSYTWPVVYDPVTDRKFARFTVHFSDNKCDDIIY